VRDASLQRAGNPGRIQPSKPFSKVKGDTLAGFGERQVGQAYVLSCQAPSSLTMPGQCGVCWVGVYSTVIENQNGNFG
jgi:hypothetical protein